MSTRGAIVLLAVMMVAVAGAALLTGCTSTFSGVCGVVPIGEDERGIAYARVYCRER